MWIYLVTAAIFLGLILKLRSGKTETFWQKHGIFEIDITPAFGSLDGLLGRKLYADADKYAYKIMGTTHKFCGITQMGANIFLVKDLNLAKKILIKDYEYFMDRRQFFNKEDGILEKLMFNLKGDEWKVARSSFSSTFTTGKIRRMMEYFNLVGQEWVQEYTRKAQQNGGSVVIDVLKSVNEYALDVISNLIFGTNANVIKNPDCTFANHANAISRLGKAQTFKFTMRALFPTLSRLLGFSIYNRDNIEYFEHILKKELQDRLNGERKRNDFIQLMVEAKKGVLKAAGADELSNYEKEAQISTDGKKQSLTEELMLAVSFSFYFAGFSSTATVITFVLYALALHKDVQDRLREEVDTIMKEDGTLEYDALGQLVYMDMVVNEVLRFLFGASRAERVCVKDYRDEESGAFIPKGTMVGIATSGIHLDPKYYDDPEKFNPENFAQERKAKRDPYAFMPFGVGPRMCIGMRFALTEVKSVVAHILHSFTIDPTPSTPTPLQGEPTGVQLTPPTNLELRLVPINKTM